MTANPFQPFATQLDWTPIDASISATISSKPAVGGFGLIGRASLSKVAALIGTADPLASAANAGYTG
jgi:hypothetical protein